MRLWRWGEGWWEFNNSGDRVLLAPLRQAKLAQGATEAEFEPELQALITCNDRYKDGAKHVKLHLPKAAKDKAKSGAIV